MQNLREKNFHSARSDKSGKENCSIRVRRRECPCIRLGKHKRERHLQREGDTKELSISGDTHTRDRAHTFLLQYLRARLSLFTRKSSRHRFSYGAKPATSRTTDRTKATRLFWCCVRQ